MFPRRKIIAIFTALAVCFAGHIAAAFQIAVLTGKWRRRSLLPRERKESHRDALFNLPRGTCVMTFGDPKYKKGTEDVEGLENRYWHCKRVPIATRGSKPSTKCRTKGVALFRNKKGELRLDHYRTWFGYRKNALVHFCAGEGVKMRKMIGKPVYFYWEASKVEKKDQNNEDLYFGKWDGYYLSVDTKQETINAEYTASDDVDDDDDYW